MFNESRLEIGNTIAIQKPDLDIILERLQQEGYQTIGPKIKNDTLVYETIETMTDLPQGYMNEQTPGQFRLKEDKGAGYFDAIPGAQSWKQFLFPSRTELFKLQKNGKGWEVQGPQAETP